MSGAIRLFYNWGNHEINDGYYTGEDPQNYLFRSTDRNLGVLFTNLSGSLKGITSRLVSIIKTGVVMLGIR